MSSVSSSLPLFPDPVEARWIYSMRNRGVIERLLTVRTQKGGAPLEICVMTDLHINYCNEEDLKDPVLASTAEHRVAFDRRHVLPNIDNCFHYINEDTRTIILGDIYDYLSQGVIELTDRHVFSHKNVIACLGGHELYRQMQGTVPDPLPFEERRAMVAAHWCNDVDYYSEVLGDRVMPVLMDNGFGFLPKQIELLRRDIARAREEQLTMLIFFHTPLNSGREEDRALKALWKGNVSHWNFCDSAEYVGPTSTGVDGEIYRLLTEHADVVRAIFAGHVHSDFYTTLPASTPDGRVAAIPQYTIHGASYNLGHLLRLQIL